MLFILPRCSEGRASSPVTIVDRCCAAEKDLQQKSMEVKCGDTMLNKERGLPLGVVVAVIVNLPDLDLRVLAREIARTFENVDFSL